MRSAAQLRYPFLTLEQAAGVLELSPDLLDRRLEAGDLPVARRVDGGEFQPTSGKRLIPYLELRRHVAGRQVERLDAWQRGELDLRKEERSR